MEQLDYDYRDGFMSKCAEYRVDAEALLKEAGLWSTLAGGAHKLHGAISGTGKVIGGKAHKGVDMVKALLGPGAKGLDTAASKTVRAGKDLGKSVSKGVKGLAPGAKTAPAAAGKTTAKAVGEGVASTAKGEAIGRSTGKAVKNLAGDVQKGTHSLQKGQMGLTAGQTSLAKGQATLGRGNVLLGEGQEALGKGIAQVDKNVAGVGKGLTAGQSGLGKGQAMLGKNQARMSKGIEGLGNTQVELMQQLGVNSGQVEALARQSGKSTDQILKQLLKVNGNTQTGIAGLGQQISAQGAKGIAAGRGDTKLLSRYMRRMQRASDKKQMLATLGIGGALGTGLALKD